MSSADRWDAYIESQPEPAPLKPLRLPPGMSWRADKTLVGHLLPRSRNAVERYLCGLPPVALALAWPMRERCAGCVAELERGRV